MASYSIDQLERMYPKTYERVYPFVYDLISRYAPQAGVRVDDEAIGDMVDEVMMRSGMWDDDSFTGNEDDAVPVDADCIPGEWDDEFGPCPVNPYPGQSRNRGLRDLIRVLLLRELLERRGHRRHRNRFYRGQMY